MILTLFQKLFGCLHKKTTFPLFSKKERVNYITCLDCGSEFIYNWELMERGEKRF